MIYLPNAQVALAHPFFVDSTPPPFSNQPSIEKIEIIFSEPIELGYSKISVIGPEGKIVDTGDAQHGAEGRDTSSLAVTLPSNIPEGSYTVSSTVLSAVDGHVVDYSFVFGIGEGAVPASSESASSSIDNNIGTRGTGEDTLKDTFALEEAAARYPGYVGQIIVVGAVFATLWLWRPFRNMPWPSAILSEHRAKIDKNVIRLVLLGIGLVLGSGVAIIFVQSLSIGAGIPEAIATKFGNIWTIRMILASTLLIVTVSIYRGVARRSRTARTKETTVILALGISIIFSYSLISHAAAIKSAAVYSILIDFFHGIAASVWIGGLIVLAFVMVPKVIKISDNMAKACIISIMIPRFSAIAVFILGIIIITGPLLLWNLENDISLVTASWYGKILVIKLSLAAVMIVIGAYHQVISQKKATREVVIAYTIENNKKITRRDNDSSSSSSSSSSGNDNNSNASSSPFGQSTKFGNFDKTLKAEACIGIALLLMVSLMANMTLPSGEFPSYGRQSGEEDGDTSFSSSFALGQTPETKTDYSQARYIDNDGNTIKVEILISPFAIGQNQFKVSFTNVSNSVSSPSPSSPFPSSDYTTSDSMTENYLTTIENATIKLTQLEEGIGPIEVETKQEFPGVFVANAALSLQGTWNIQIEGQTSEPGVPNIVATFDDVFVKPKISNIISNVTEYKTPEESLPLYPIYDESRQSIWVGDSMPESGRIWQFDIASKNYTEHQIDNVSLITVTALDPEGNIWYIDPSKSILGKYDVGNKENTQFNVPGEGIISGLAMDNNQNLWMAVIQANTIVKFNSMNQTFTSYNIPTSNALPGTITFDREANNIWFTEGVGKIARIDPETGNITEFAPTTSSLSSSLRYDNPLEEPTMAFPDPKTFDIYITEHEGNRITAYNQFLDTFEEYPIVNDQGLPFGMAIDKFGNLWFAQHVIDRVAAIDAKTGESIEVDVPINGSFIQYLTSDNDGNIWFAAQRASSIGSIITSPGPPLSGVDASTSTEAVVATTVETQEQQQQEREKVGGYVGTLISYFGLDFADIIGPLLTGGIILAALLYSKTVIDLKLNIDIVTRRAR